MLIKSTSLTDMDQYSNIKNKYIKRSISLENLSLYENNLLNNFIEFVRLNNLVKKSLIKKKKYLFQSSFDEDDPNPQIVFIK